MKDIALLFAFVYRQARGLVSLAIVAGLVSGAAGAAQIAVLVIPEAASNSALFLGGLAYLGWLSPPLLGLFLLFFIPLLAIYRAPIASTFSRYREAREEEDALYGYFTGVTSGTKELKLNRDRRGAYLRRMAGTADTLRRLFTRANLTLAAVVAFGWTFFMALIGLIVFGAPRALHVAARDPGRLRARAALHPRTAATGDRQPVAARPRRRGARQAGDARPAAQPGRRAGSARGLTCGPVHDLAELRQAMLADCAPSAAPDTAPVPYAPVQETECSSP